MLVDVRTLGAAADGVNNDTTVINNALALGQGITSGGATCAVLGDITLPNGAWLQNIKFKQLSPSATNRRTLIKTSGSGPITLINVSVNRAGATTDGSITDPAAGIYIAN